MKRVLIKEKIADAGIQELKEHFDVDLGLEWNDNELAERIADYDAIIIRSATKLTADLIDRADRLTVIARAGIGVDNVDVKAATKKGIVVANAPQSNTIAAAEHTIALLLALARQIPQAHASLSQHKWERSKFGGIEVFEKTLGILGFGRIGQLVASRCIAFGMQVIAFDPYVSPERFRELGVQKVDSIEELFKQTDFLTLHLMVTEETKNILNQKTFIQMKSGIRIINCARGELIDESALKDALDSGHVGGAALDVFRGEPVTEHPLFGYDNVVVTPHLGASTTEAQDRAGIQAAEQVIAALSGSVVTTAVNIPSVSSQDMDVLGPFLPLCERLGKFAMTLAAGSNVERVEFEYLGRIADRDTRLLTLAGLNGILTGRTEESVNYVNAPGLAAERGIEVSESRTTKAQDYSDLIKINIKTEREQVRVIGTTLGNHHRPHLLEAWGKRFNVQIDDPYIAIFRYTDVPGMVGKVGSILGDQNINISSAAVGRGSSAVSSGDRGTDNGGEAVMVLTTDRPISPQVIDQIVAIQGFIAGRSLSFVQ